MMKWIFGLLIALSLIFGAGNNRMEQVSSAALSSCGEAVTLALTLTGSICMWNGVMAVAQESGLTEKLALLIAPVTTRIFRGVEKTSRTMQLITMNITANFLGLGNAATPLGLAAMAELEKEIPPDQKGTASDNMVLFTVLNTASIQLVPTTVAVLRLKYGSSSPLDVIPAVLIASVCSITVGLSLAKLLNRIFPAVSAVTKGETP